MERINLTKEERLWCRQEAQRVLEAAEAEDLATEGDFLPGPNRSENYDDNFYPLYEL